MVRSDFASGLVGGRSPGLDDDVFRLWDGLSDFEASESGQAAAWLLEQLAALVGVENVTWAGAVRMDADPEDPLQGWRVARMQALRPPSEAAEGAAPEYAEILGAWDRRKLDPSFLLPMRDVGGFRTYSFRRDLPKAWFSGAFYRTHYAAAGVHDAAFVAFPVNADCESHLGVFSGRPIPEAAIARLALVSRGLKWFHRRLMLSHGLLAASAPLTPAEQRVLHLLLTEASEKEVAGQLGLAASTVHEHVLRLYRKYGVHSRVGLMSLWLRRSPA
jgi:Response regulator containing a CheY-like receiver domain and an HTH DNA-binding domain